MREVIFYKKENGDCPVEEFLDSLIDKHAARIAWVLGLVEDLQVVPRQYFKKLVGTYDIWEIRVDSGSDTFRLLGFFDKGNLVILTNGFVKKSQRTPDKEIKLAEQRKLDYKKRKI